MNDLLTVPARDGIEAQRGHNDIFPGDPSGEMFARGWDASNVALGLDDVRLTAGDFFRVRRALASTAPAGETSPEREG